MAATHSPNAPFVPSHSPNPGAANSAAWSIDITMLVSGNAEDFNATRLAQLKQALADKARVPVSDVH
eukprot:7219957-Prymnesium_polylepis.1